jgi:hypothetical protein
MRLHIAPQHSTHMSEWGPHHHAAQLLQVAARHSVATDSGVRHVQLAAFIRLATRTAASPAGSLPLANGPRQNSAPDMRIILPSFTL